MGSMAASYVVDREYTAGGEVHMAADAAAAAAFLVEMIVCAGQKQGG